MTCSESFEERPEVDALMDAADCEPTGAQIARQLFGRVGGGGVAIADHARQPVGGLGRSRQGVHLLLVLELQPVLDLTEKPIGVEQRVSVTAVDVAGVGQLVDRHHCRRLTKAGIGMPVHEL